MPDYNNTKIYKIYSPSNDALVYYGHTTKEYVSQRLAKHKYNYNQWCKNTDEHRVSSFCIFEQCNDYIIVLVENYPCKDVNEARARERYYIENNNCVNKNIPGRTQVEADKEYKKNNKERIKVQQKEYQLKNRDYLTHHRSNWYQENKDLVNQKVKQYREANKEKISEHAKQYYALHKLEILQKNKEKIQCICGFSYCKITKARHEKSQRHIQYVQSLSPSECSSNV